MDKPKERINTKCGCAMSKLPKGAVVCIEQEEVNQGLMIYCGESHHSTKYRHLVKVISMEGGDAAASWHVPCGQVYVPVAPPWPYFRDWFNEPNPEP